MIGNVPSRGLACAMIFWRNALKPIRSSAVALSALLASAVLAAPPTTRPVPPKPPDRDTTECVAGPVSARFRVPKTWQHKEIAGGLPGKMFLFDPAPASKKPSAFLQWIEVYLDHPRESQKTQEDVVNDLRQALIKKAPGLKFSQDASLKFAGRTAWALQWTEQTKATITPVAGGPTKETTMESERAEIVFLDHATLCEFGLFADPGFMPSLIRKADSVAKTLAWDQ